jgi:hypothetical protein
MRAGVTKFNVVITFCCGNYSIIYFAVGKGGSVVQAKHLLKIHEALLAYPIYPIVWTTVL